MDPKSLLKYHVPAAARRIGRSSDPTSCDERPVHVQDVASESHPARHVLARNSVSQQAPNTYTANEAYLLAEHLRQKMAGVEQVYVVNCQTDEAQILIPALQQATSGQVICLDGTGPVGPVGTGPAGTVPVVPQNPGPGRGFAGPQEPSPLVPLVPLVPELVPEQEPSPQFPPTGPWVALVFRNQGTPQSVLFDRFLELMELLEHAPHGQVIVVSEASMEGLGRCTYQEIAENEYLELTRGTDSAVWDEACKTAHDKGLNTVLLRYANLFGPGIAHSWNQLNLSELCRQAAHSETLTVHLADAAQTHSATYIGDLLQTISKLPATRPREWSYNVVSHATSAYEVIVTLSTVLPDLPVQFPAQMPARQPSYCLLQAATVKFFSVVPGDTLRAQLWTTVMSQMPTDQVDQHELNAYSYICHGKLDKVHQLQLEVLQEVQRICDKHHLTYFLVGGSLLGAVRHQGFIPWDDDLDIGFLRADFDVFRQVAPSELADRFLYQSWRSKDGNHYVFDKIRVRDTRMSTEWAFRHAMPDGVFVDILVFDKTSNLPWLRQAHVLLARMVKRAIALKWINFARQQVHYHWSVVGLPVVRLLPWRLLHCLLERLLRAFRRVRAKYIIDGVGLMLKLGPFPSEWFASVQPAEFEGLTVNIPSGYEGYLTMWYGPDHMTPPPPSARRSHNIAALDLGGYHL